MKPWNTAAGAIGGAMLFSEVITQQVEARRVLAASELRLRLAQQAAGLGTWEYDLNSGIAVWSEQARALIGMAPDEAASLNQLLSRVHADDRPSLVAEITRARQPGAGQFYRAEFRVILPNGAIRWLENQGRVEHGADGHPSTAVGVVRDISERKTYEQQTQLLMREVNHRSKNILSRVQAIAQQTATREPNDFLARFQERLRALATNQDLLIKSGWKGVRLDTLVNSLLAHFQGSDRSSDSDARTAADQRCLGSPNAGFSAS